MSSSDNSTEEENIEREKNELDAVGDFKCEFGMSAENVPAVVDI